MLTENTFAWACCRMNTVTELRNSLKTPPDQWDMAQWGLTEHEYYAELQAALNELENNHE